MQSIRLSLGLASVLSLLPVLSVAAPFTPTADSVVVEHLPLRAQDATSRTLNTLRSRWRQEPNNPEFAADLARAYFDLGDYVRARQEFEFVLRYNPPAEVGRCATCSASENRRRIRSVEH
jgi:thioredoxin-like negative regulator of GroEL